MISLKTYRIIVSAMASGAMLGTLGAVAVINVTDALVRRWRYRGHQRDA